MSNMRFRTIIFLEEDGTGLSPYAEALLAHKLQMQGIWGFEIYSRGNVVLFPEPANQKIQELARRKGTTLSGYRAKPLTGEEFADDTLILAFDAASKQNIYDRFPNAVNVYMLREFVGEAGDIRLPIGGSMEEYEAVCAVVDRVTDRLIDKLMEREEPI